MVTSDKAVLARYGKEIWAAAKKSGQQLRFEACVGGGIPVIRSLSESFAVEQPEAVFGIVNGTCNYILSQMEKSGKPYAEALQRGAAKGLRRNQSGSRRQRQRRRSQIAAAEHWSPSACRSSRARSGAKGIEEIQAVDFRYAQRIGASTIKQLAVARRRGSAVQVFVSPALVSAR